MISNGEYVVNAIHHNPGTNEVVSREIGRFTVVDSQIVAVSGESIKDIISEGYIDPMTEFRIETSLNNGYFSTSKVA